MQLRLSVKHAVNICLIIMIFFAVGVSNAYAGIANSKHDFSMGNALQGVHFAGMWLIGSSTENGPYVEEICVFCHTPHHSANATTDPQSVADNTNQYLWNRRSSPLGYTYTPYTSPTSTISAPDNGGRPTGISMMCMSCHDGVTSIAANVGGVSTLLNIPNAAGVSNQISIDPASGMNSPGAIGNIFKGIPQQGGWGANIGNALPGSSTIDMSNDHPVSFEFLVKPGYKTPVNPALRLFGMNRNRIECATCHSVHDPTIEPFLVMSNARSEMCLNCHEK